MISTLIRIYNKTSNETLLTAAVVKGWITEAEKQEIVSAAGA